MAYNKSIMSQTSTRSQTNTMAMVLTGYGLPHTLGYIKTKSGDAHPPPYSIFHLMDLAAELGFAGIEIPLSQILIEGREDNIALEAIILGLKERGQRIVPDYPGTVLEGTIAQFTSFFAAARRLGAPLVRMTLSRVLCGDRRDFSGGWPHYWQEVIERLSLLLPLAEELGLIIAIENHQDVTSDDLIELYEKTGSSTAFGICLDTGNALAVGEDPLLFAQKLSPLVHHAHCKDYTIYFAPNGYRLVRVAAGAGVIPFPEILAQSASAAISLGCEDRRTNDTHDSYLRKPSWWQEHRPEQSQHLPEALQTLWKYGRPESEPYGSAWERGEDSRSGFCRRNRCRAPECAVFQEYFRSILVMIPFRRAYPPETIPSGQRPSSSRSINGELCLTDGQIRQSEHHPERRTLSGRSRKARPFLPMNTDEEAGEENSEREGLLRSLYDRVSEIHWGLAGYAAQLLHFQTISRFCPRCGTATTDRRSQYMGKTMPLLCLYVLSARQPCRSDACP